MESEVKKYLQATRRPFAPIRFLNLLPLSHMFGQAMATFIPPMLPGVVVFMRGFDPNEILRQIRTRRISVLVSVPQILEILREHLHQTFPELSQSAAYARATGCAAGGAIAKCIACSAGNSGASSWAPRRSPADLEAFFSELGFLVIQGYGFTETAPIVTLNHPFHARKGSVGKPIAGVEVKIAADGEILVRGENVTSGYFQQPEETARAFEDGWFHTGDIGELKENGELAILGRKKEMIVTPEGLNVFPEDVESVLNQQPGVRDAAVIGTDRVHAVLILDPEPNAGRNRAPRQRASWPITSAFAAFRFGPTPNFRAPKEPASSSVTRSRKGTPPPKQAGRVRSQRSARNL